MKMQRLYFVSDSLDDLEAFEVRLEAGGISTPQIHVLSRDDTGVENHQHLHEVQSIMKCDLIFSTLQGAGVGIGLAVMLLIIVDIFELAHTSVGWEPFILLSMVVLGFCSWEGGLIGIQKPNSKFVRFEQVLDEGKHVLFVDLEPSQNEILEEALKSHSNLELFGSEKSHLYWLVILQKKVGLIRHT